MDINKAYYDYYFNKILFKEIIEEHCLYLKQVFLQNELNILNNIQNDIFSYNITIKNNIDSLNIKFNNGICFNDYWVLS